MIALLALLAVVSASNNTVSYSCDGSTAAFTVNFPYLAQTDLTVKSTTAGGVVTALTLVTDYSLNVTSTTSTATITLTNPSTKCPSGSTLNITRTLNVTQPQSFRQQTKFDPSTVEAALDRRAMVEQQLQALYTNPPATVLPANVVAKLNGVRFADQFNNIQAAITDASTTGAVLIPPTYTATDTWVNPNNIPVFDWRQHGPDLGTISVKAFGAVGDNSHDDTGNIQTAINFANGGTVVFPPGTYKMSSGVTVTAANTRILGLGGKIHMAFTSSLPVGGILFDVTASNVQFDGMWVDATGDVNSPVATINHYAIKFHGTSGTHLNNLKVRNCTFTSLPWNDTLGAVVTTHAVYVQWADNVTVQDSRFDAIAGAAVFFSGVTQGYVLSNFINNTGWYSIQFNDLVSNSRIAGNSITGTTPGDRVWGGSINLMSNDSTGTACGTQGCARVKDVEIDHNYISGNHSYTSPVHIESTSYVKFHDNRMEKITLSTAAEMLARYGQHFGSGATPFYADGSPAVYVRPYVRPTDVPATGNEGPNDHLEISNNLLIAGSVGAIGIYADAQDNGSAGAPLFQTLPYSDTLTISNNIVQSLDTTHYFSNGISVHGQQGGWKSVSILNNSVSGFPDGTSPNLGLIGTQALVAAPVLDVNIANNQVSVVGGTPSSTTHLGIGIGAFTQNARVGGNTVRGFWTGIRTFVNSSTVLVGPANMFVGTLNANYLLGVQFINSGAITLVAGTGTATVLAGAQCTCTDTAPTPAIADCAVGAGTFPASTATLTATGTAAHVITYNCY